MKRKMILPLLAVLFAAASALSSQPFLQTAWFNDGGEAASGTISNTSNECAVGRTIQCTIGTAVAYDSPEHAQMEDPAGLLKYNNVP